MNPFLWVIDTSLDMEDAGHYGRSALLRIACFGIPTSLAFGALAYVLTRWVL